MNLYQAWIELNDNFIWSPQESQFWVGGEPGLSAGREFSTIAYNTTMVAEGWGLPETSPYVNPDRRNKLLHKRYVNQPMWDESLERLKAHRLSGPMSFSFPFYRAADTAPSGGGCLISLCLTWYRKTWSIHVMSRASEVTTRLIGDIYFVKERVDSILESVGGLRNWPDNPRIDWTLLMASQMKHIIPFYILDTHGEQEAEEYLTSDPVDQRQKGAQDYFWKYILHPELVTWAQRRKWSEKFVEKVDHERWMNLKQELGK